MEYLKEIIKVINKNKVKQIQIIGNGEHQKGKIYELYEGIHNNTFTSDEDACQQLFGVEKINQSYRNLKSQLEKRLINTVFFTDTNSASFTEYQKAYYNCYKNMAAMKIFIGKYARNASNRLAEKTLSQALKFQFCDIAIIILRELRHYYGTIKGDRKKFRKYHDLLEEQLLYFQHESRVKEMYDMLASNFTDSKSSKPELLNEAIEYCKELDEYLKINSTLSFRFLAYLIMALRYEIENNNEQTVRVCDEALTFLQGQEFKTTSQVFAFYFKKLNSLIPLKRYAEAESSVKECLKLVPENSLNWLLTYQFYFILLFHAQKFQQAYDIYSQGNFIKKSENFPEGITEFWNIIDAFMYYFILSGKVVLSEDAKKKRFRMGKFRNTVPAFSKDKRGMNISVLILQLLIWLKEKNFDEVISRTDALQAYTSKYLRRDDTFRSNCFIKMLVQIPLANFSRIALKRRAKPYVTKLKTMPLESANQSNEVEPVPYEILWGFVLESMDNTVPPGWEKRRKKK